jgi:integrase
MFLYDRVLGIELTDPIDAVRAKRPEMLPVVLSQSEAFQIIGIWTGDPQMTAKPLYGTGLRLRESLRLRVKDIDFSMHQMIFRSGKGGKDRVTQVPECLQKPLKRHCKSYTAWQ